MKQLILKELREMRLIPLAYASILCSLLCVWRIMSDGNTGIDRFTNETTITLLFFACMLSGWLTGSNAIAHETGEGTLQFLTLLPMGRSHIWRAKGIAGAIMTLASMIVMILCHFLVVVSMFGLHQVLSTNLGWMKTFGSMMPLILGGSLYTYSVALLVSTLVDRVLAATIISLLLEIAYLVIVLSLAGSSPALMLFLVVLVIVACLSASWIVFVRGESLQTFRRFQLTGIVMGTWFGTGSVALMLYEIATSMYLPFHYWLYQLFNNPIK